MILLVPGLRTRNSQPCHLLLECVAAEESYILEFAACSECTASSFSAREVFFDPLMRVIKKMEEIILYNYLFLSPEH